jgi:hypothetical protein
MDFTNIQTRMEINKKSVNHVPVGALSAHKKKMDQNK